VELKEAIEHIIDGNALLFVGAGYSGSAKNNNNQKLPTSKKLKVILGEQLGLTDISEHSLQTIAGHFAKENSELRLFDFLQKLYTVEHLEDPQIYLATLPWKAIYTTNFDNAIEIAHLRSKQRIASFIKSDHSPVGSAKKFCMHINGSIDKEYNEETGTGLTLTTAEYAADELNKSSWGTRLRDDFSLAKVIIFAGYSLFDIDIERMLYKSADLKEKTFFVNGDSTDKLSIERYSEYGTYTGLNLNEFCDRILVKAKDYKAKEVSPNNFFAIEKYAPERIVEQNVSKSLYELLMYGAVDTRLVRHSIIENKDNYYIRRDEIDTIAQVISNGGKNIIIHSEIGNGKSLLLEGVKANLSSVMDVYTVSRKDYLTDEIRRLTTNCSDGRKIAICIDGYGKYFEEIQFIQRNRSQNIVLVLAEKTALHDVLEKKLIACIGAVDTYSFDVNTLRTRELKLVKDLLSSAGYWGESYRPSEELLRSLKNTWNCSFRNILLDVFKSPNIAGKISKALTKIPAAYKKPFYTSLILSIINSTSEIYPSIVNDLTGTYDACSATFTNNQYIRSLVSIGVGKIHVSSILASHILTSCGDSREIIESAITIAQRSHGNPYYKQYFREMMRFGNLQRLLPTQNKLGSIEHYYENIRNLDDAKNNPYFWLQYGIGRLTCKDYLLSEKLFDTAYRMGAKSLSFDTYQIDNHYARLLLSCDTMAKYPNPMDRFDRARTIILAQLTNGDSHQFQYSCRSAGTILQFYNDFVRTLTQKDLAVIKSTCLRILELLEKNQFAQRQLDLLECKKRLNIVLSEMV
jgi:hypothetical protein